MTTGDKITAGIALLAVIVSIMSIFLSRKLSRLQQFETTFFNMLESLGNIVYEMELRSNKTKDIIRQGRKCFKTFYKYLLKIELNIKKQVALEANPLHYNESEAEKITLDFEQLIKAYEDHVFIKYQNDLGHYFRTLYHTIRFVDESRVISSERKRHYIRLLRAQLSSYELIILYYNGLSSYAVDQFKPLIDRYDLLKNLDWALIRPYLDRNPKRLYKFEWISEFGRGMPGTVTSKYF